MNTDLYKPVAPNTEEICRKQKKFDPNEAKKENPLRALYNSKFSTLVLDSKSALLFLFQLQTQSDHQISKFWKQYLELFETEDATELDILYLILYFVEDVLKFSVEKLYDRPDELEQKLIDRIKTKHPPIKCR